MRIAIPDDYQDLVHTLRCFARLGEHEVVRYREPAADPEAFVRRLEGVHAIVPIRERSRFPRELLERLPDLRLISQTGRSTHHVDVAACTELGIVVSAGSNASPIAPAEFTWALIVAARRHVVEEVQRLRADQWPGTLSHRLAGSTLGIFGLGLIGERVARVGAAFDMKVLVWGREASLARARSLGYAVADSQDDLFERSDVLSLHVRLSAATRGIVKAADLARMKPTALLVNTARGELIEPGALAEALRAGRPGQAAVDVFDDEPLIGRGEPLVALPNALCTHHVAWAEHDTFELYFGEAFDNVLAYARGEPRGVVNPDVLDRARPRP